MLRRGAELARARSPRLAALRWVAALSLSVVFGGGGWGATAFYRHERALGEDPATPFRPDSLAGVGPDLRPTMVPVGASVVLYVSGHCPFCRAELRAWSRLMASSPGQPAPWVVVAPDTDLREARALLAAFRERWMLDRTGAVGRSLGVRAVPFVAVMDSTGLVVEAHAGLSSPHRLAHLAAILN